MKNHERCGNVVSHGQLFKLFVQKDADYVNHVVQDLNQHFDRVLVTPARCGSDEPECQGFEILAIKENRDGQTDSDAEFTSIERVLRNVWPKDRPKRAELRDMIDELEIHEHSCGTGKN
jgi:hypothetical protein